MSERSIVDAAARLRKQAEPYLVATVVAADGPVYRRPGARMLLTRYRWIAGTVSGSCLEGDVASSAWSDTRTGEPKLIAFDAATPVDDDDLRSAFGLGYEGRIEVLIERGGQVGKLDPLAVAGRCYAQQQRGAVVTLFETDGEPRIGARIALVGESIEDDRDAFSGALRDRLIQELHDAAVRGTSVTRTIDTARGSVRVLVEAIVPPPTLFVFGTGHDAVPVAKLAHELGWHVVVCGKDGRHVTRDRFPVADELVSCDLADLAPRIDACDRAVGVVIGHDHARDRDVLGMLLGTRARFIGVLGPVRRTTRMLAELGRATDPRLHAAADIGIDGPQEAALSLLAEIHDAIKQPLIVGLPSDTVAVAA